MFFTKKNLSAEQINSRLFEFKGAVQTCDLNVIKLSAKVLTYEFGENINENKYFKEIEDFNESLTETGSRRKILYYSFENLLNSVKVDKKIQLNFADNLPHGFSCPKGNDMDNKIFKSYWENSNLLKKNLDDQEIAKRTKLFSDFINAEVYNDDILNDIKWHKSELTHDIVSGSSFAGEKLTLPSWNAFSELISSSIFIKPTQEAKNKMIDAFLKMLQTLPFNNFKY